MPDEPENVRNVDTEVPDEPENVEMERQMNPKMLRLKSQIYHCSLHLNLKYHHNNKDPKGHQNQHQAKKL